MSQIVALKDIAAFANCLEDVDMKKVGAYRKRLRHSAPPPISLRRKNKDGYYICNDGHHRLVAHYLERMSYISAIVDGPGLKLQWRWPRVSPILDSLKLLRREP
jgi:hypothetical protein